MKKNLLMLLTIFPIFLFGNNHDVETDIVERTINFVIFFAILWYLLADKIKAYFNNRTLSIKNELEKVQEALKASQDRVIDAQEKLDEARILAVKIVDSAKNDVDVIKQKIISAADNDIINLNKNFEEMAKFETTRQKKLVVSEILEELLKSDNIHLTQKELVDIVLKKVA